MKTRTRLLLAAASISLASLTGCAGMPGAQMLGDSSGSAFVPADHGAVRITERGKVMRVEAATVEVNANGVTQSMVSSTQNLANEKVGDHGGWGTGVSGAVGSVASSVIDHAASRFSDRLRHKLGVRLTIDSDTGLQTISQLGSASDFSVGQKVLIRTYQDGVEHVVPL